MKLAAGLIDSITGCGWKAAALPSCRRGRATAHSCISEGPCAVLSRLNVQMDIWTWGRNTTPHAASQQACFPSQPHSVLAEPMLSNPCVGSAMLLLLSKNREVLQLPQHAIQRKQEDTGHGPHQLCAYEAVHGNTCMCTQVQQLHGRL